MPIIVHYDTEICKEIIINALENDYYMILHFLWAFGKNKHEHKNNLGEFILYNELFKSIKIIKEGGKNTIEEKRESIDQFITNVVNWLVITDDNILIALLQHEYDNLALDWIGYYTDDINVDLLLYCLKNGDEPFLKKALKMLAFDKLIFRQAEVINEFIRLLKTGSRTNYQLNILTLVGLSIWKTNTLKNSKKYSMNMKVII